MSGKARDIETMVKAIVGENGTGLKPRNSFPPRKTLDEIIQVKREIRNEQLIDAVIRGRFDRVKDLCTRGADVNAKDEKGRSALKWAVFTGNKEIEEFLRARGAKE
ncbi:ankyrin repeat domain-containing protein [Candidatus Micrarchaeota archaeon]|nr:ankyrin repeat domain-containing protein [Candidatus Micrarchaeota archaeon]